jgi:3-hydroxybutyryl-CoA dehydrogenase
MSKEIVGIVGAGTMGAGIAQVALEAGHEVILDDVDEAAVERGRGRIRDGLARRAAKLDLDADTIGEWVDGRLQGLREAVSLDAVGGEADLVIEAALEDLDLKRTIFRTLDAAAGDRARVILATNTSALSIAAIASSTSRPERVIGLHFFNPAPLMALVEVVGHAGADPTVLDQATKIVTAWGKVPVRSTDTPGFIVNRVNRPFTIEALRLLEAGDASVERIDGAVRAAGFPMGPFELMDLVGIDVNLAAATSIWEALGHPDRLRPSPIQERLVAAERLGRKTGAGFYEYAGGAPTVSAEFTATDGDLDEDEIVGRIVAAIDTEADLALADAVASETDIDLALRLGAGHPSGPLERRSFAREPASPATGEN